MIRRFALVCGSLAIALCPPYAAGEEGRTLDVRDFGALGDGVANDAPAINRAFAEGVKSGAGTTIFIPRGRYHLEVGSGGHLRIEGARGLVVRGGEGAILAGQNPDSEIVTMVHCTGVAVRKLTLEQEKTYFTQGTIETIAADGRSCEVKIDPRYDEPDAPHLANLITLRSFSYSDTTSYRQDRWWPTVKSRTQTGERAWHLEFDGWSLLPNFASKPFIIWDDKHGGHGFHLHDCGDCLIEDVEYHGRGTNAGLFLTDCPGDLTFRRFNITAPPDTGALLSCSGGGQMIDCRGNLVFEACHFDKVDDDGADILTGYDRVLKQIDARTIQVEGHRHFQARDRLAILDWPTKADRHQVSIVSATREPGNTTTLALDQDVQILRAGPATGGDAKEKNNDGIDRVTDYNLACSSATFRKCRIQALRARGLNLKAQNCLIEDCTFYDCEMPAVSGGPEFYWGEGPAIHKFTVRNNRFVNCNSRCIDIAYFDAGVQCLAKENQEILIEGNTFTHWGAHETIHRGFAPQCPIRIANADGVVIRNNTFEDAGAPDRPVRVLIEKSSFVTLEGNRNLPETAILRR